METPDVNDKFGELSTGVQVYGPGEEDIQEQEYRGKKWINHFSINAYCKIKLVLLYVAIWVSVKLETRLFFHTVLQYETILMQIT